MSTSNPEAPKPRTCAICTALSRRGAMEPLGKNNAMVFVCASCSEDRTLVRPGLERGYEQRDRVPSITEMRAAADRVLPKSERATARAIARGPMGRATNPGYSSSGLPRTDRTATGATSPPLARPSRTSHGPLPRARSARPRGTSCSSALIPRRPPRARRTSSLVPSLTYPSSR